MKIQEIYTRLIDEPSTFLLDEESLNLEQKKVFKELFESMDQSHLRMFSYCLTGNTLQEQEALNVEALAEEAKGIRFRAFRKGDDFVLFNNKNNKQESVWFNDFKTGEIKQYRNLAGVENAINELRAEGYQELTSDGGIKSAVHLFYLRHRKLISPFTNPSRQIKAGGILLTIALMSFLFGFPPLGATSLEISLGIAGIGAIGRGWFGMMITPKRFWKKQKPTRR